MVDLIINGKPVTADEGEMLLAVIRRQNIEIPALCDHPSVEPYGACRLCMVEITKEEWDGWTNHVTSCLYPVESGLIVNTHTPRLHDLRKTLIDLHLARNPNTPLIQQLGQEYGLNRTSYEVVPEPDDCILCGLCTRICDRMGFSAISAVNRGHGKEIAPPLKEAPPDCVGCLACALNCPTDFIEYTDDGNKRTIWGRTFKLIKCEGTGQPGITEEFADYQVKHRNINPDYFKQGDEAHRRETAGSMGRIVQWSREEELS
jgi:NADH dehydrogenase/NADH:ubiquinone oxidoreductase subunit G